MILPSAFGSAYIDCVVHSIEEKQAGEWTARSFHEPTFDTVQTANGRQMARAPVPLEKRWVVTWVMSAVQQITNLLNVGCDVLS